MTHTVAFQLFCSHAQPHVVSAIIISVILSQASNSKRVYVNLHLYEHFNNIIKYNTVALQIQRDLSWLSDVYLFGHGNFHLVLQMVNSVLL